MQYAKMKSKPYPEIVLNLLEHLQKSYDHRRISYLYGSPPSKRESSKDHAMTEMTPTNSARKASTPARRYGFDAKVMIHKNGRYVKGQSANVSCSGLFVRSDQKIFRENESVRLYIRPYGLGKSYHARARVVRYQQSNGEEGYGLTFIA